VNHDLGALLLRDLTRGVDGLRLVPVVRCVSRIPLTSYSPRVWALHYVLVLAHRSSFRVVIAEFQC
jgi:hypothetical protein